MTAHTGEHIWIIGASSGIGRALAVACAAQGAVVIASARRADELAALGAEIGARHHMLPLDVTDAAALARAASHVAATVPRIDRIIHMAAIYEPAPLAAMNTQAAARMVEVNLTGALNVVAAVLPVLRVQGGGQVALCGSVAGFRGLPRGQPYSATKAAIINLAESLRAEEAVNGIDARVINPGFVRTPMTAKNDFTMPMMIDPDRAAQYILRGLRGRRFAIGFPPLFHALMRGLQALPYALYFRLVGGR